MDQIILEPEPKKLDARSWSRSPKFEFRLYSPAQPHLLVQSSVKYLASRGLISLLICTLTEWSKQKS